MTPQEAERIRQTVASPGWSDIRARATAAIEQFKLEALINTEESKVIELWRNAQSAHKILNVFLQEIENPNTGIGEE